MVAMYVFCLGVIMTFCTLFAPDRMSQLIMSYFGIMLIFVSLIVKLVE